MSLSLHEAYRRLCDVETARQLLDDDVDGWAAWPLIRFEVSRLVADVTLGHGHPSTRMTRARLALGDLPRLLVVRRARHLVKTYSSGLIEQIDGRYRDIWFDDVLTAAGSVFKIEAASSQASAGRSHLALVRRDLSSSAIDLVSGLLARRAPDSRIAAIARRFADVLREDLSLRSVDEAWVAQRLQRFAVAKRIYKSIVRRVAPAFVMVVDSGEYALVAAAKELHVTVLELQHGIIDASNAGYMWPSSARGHRRRMPLPDRLLLYGEHWRRELDRDGFWADSLRVVGSPRMDRYRQRSAARARDRCHIVFTTQGIEVAAATAFLQRAFGELEEQVPFHLSVKLHPTYDADPRPYREALRSFGDRIDVLTAEEGPTSFELLQSADLHLSISSASHYDAVGLGVPTVILPLTTHEIMLPMLQAGHAHLASTPADLAALVRRWQQLKLPADVREYYFRPGALANILHELALQPAA